MNTIVKDLKFVLPSTNKFNENKAKLVELFNRHLANRGSDDDNEYNLALNSKGELVINPQVTGKPFLSSLSKNTESFDSDAVTLFRFDDQYADNALVVTIPFPDTSDNLTQIAEEVLIEYTKFSKEQIKKQQQCDPVELTKFLTAETKAFVISDYNQWLVKHLIALSQFEQNNKIFTDFRGKYAYTTNNVNELLHLCQVANYNQLINNQKVAHLLTDLIDTVYCKQSNQPTKLVIKVIADISKGSTKNSEQALAIKNKMTQ